MRWCATHRSAGTAAIRSAPSDPVPPRTLEAVPPATDTRRSLTAQRARGDRFDSSSYSLLSIVVLGASTLCAGFAMSSQDRRFVSAMAACSVIRAGLVIKAVQVVGLEDWGARSGAVIAVAAALATAVAAVMVSPTLDD